VLNPSSNLQGAVLPKTLGCYHFEMSEEVGGGDLRPLRDPDSLDTLERLWKD